MTTEQPILGVDNRDAHPRSRFALSELVDDEEARVAAAQMCAIYAPLVQPLAQALGPAAEVVLHDLTRVPNSIVAIAGSLSGRTVGGPATDLALMLLESRSGVPLIGYRTELPDGRVCRSSSIFLPVGSARPVACLCINTDQSAFYSARDALNAIIGDTNSMGPTGEMVHPNVEHFYPTVEEMAEGILKQAIAGVGESPDQMSRTQKIRVMQELRSRGFFIIREAVDLASAALNVSRFTIYKYLNELPPQDGEES